MSKGAGYHVFAATIAVAALAAAASLADPLPRNGPIPDPAPRLEPAEPSPDASAEKTDGQALPPLPEPAPREQAKAVKERPAVMPPEEAACRARLATAGVDFEEEEDALSDPSGCDMPWPITVSGLGGGIELTPRATINCATAETLAAFARDVVAPDARTTFGSAVTAIRQASGYVCRPRNGSEKLSEHAFGNAIDIASFKLSDGAEIAVDATREPERSAFLSRVREEACGPFKTVLGPGSDADHATHFHFDLAKRRSGSTFCQ
jgi:hypothetical protein